MKWTVRRSVLEGDAPGVLNHRTIKLNGEDVDAPRHNVRTELVDNMSYKPIGAVSLQREAMFNATGMAQARPRLPKIKILGSIVDGTFFVTKGSFL